MLDLEIYVIRALEVLLTFVNVVVHSIFISKLARTTHFHPMLRYNFYFFIYFANLFRRCLFLFEGSSILFSVSHSAQAIIATLLGMYYHFIFK